MGCCVRSVSKKMFDVLAYWRWVWGSNAYRNLELGFLGGGGGGTMPEKTETEKTKREALTQLKNRSSLGNHLGQPEK